MKSRIHRSWGVVNRKMKWLGVGISMVGLLVGGTPMGMANDHDNDHNKVEKGKAIYRESCQHCHGFSGKGDGEMAEYLDPHPANLASPSTQTKTDQEWIAVILHGRPGTAMAGFEGALDDAQVSDLMGYLRSLAP